MRSFCFVLALLSFTSLASAQTRIGVSTALSGNASTYGQDIQNALRFANKTLANNRYQLVFEDDACTGKGAVTVANKLVHIDRVKYVLGFACSGAVLASAPIYEKAKVLVISPSASAEAVSEAGDYIFRTWPSDAATVRILQKYLAARHKRLAILSEQTEYAEGMRKAFVEINQSSDLALSFASFLTDDKDFATLLGRLRAEKADAVFLNTQSERTFLTLLTRMRQLRLEMPVYGVYWPGSASFLKEAGDLAEGIVFVDAPLAENVLTKEGLTFYRDFKKEYGEPNYSGLLFATAFEAFRAMHLAIESGQSPKNYLYQHKFKGIFGPYSFDENGDIQGLSLSLKRIAGGTVVEYKP